MQQSNIAVNTQVTDLDIAYLAGLWDGEGSIILTKNLRKGMKFQYIARCQITNTNEAILCKVIEVLDGLNIPAFLSVKPKTKERHKQSYDVVVSRLRSIEKLMEILIPYLHGKKAVAKLMLRYVTVRLKKQKENTPEIELGERGHIKKCVRTDGYEEEEHSLYEQMKRLNQKGTSEAICETEIKDMVHAL